MSTQSPTNDTNKSTKTQSSDSDHTHKQAVRQSAIQQTSAGCLVAKLLSFLPIYESRVVSFI